jgi:hypothetical protein
VCPDWVSACPDMRDDAFEGRGNPSAWLCALACAAVAVGTPSTVRADPQPGASTALDSPDTPSEQQYRSHVRSALDEYGRGNYPEMFARMRQAHLMQPSARTLRGLGMAAYELKRYADAVGYLSDALNDPRRPLEGDLRARAEALLEQAKGYVGRVRIQVLPKGASLREAGQLLSPSPDGDLLLAIGDHSIDVSAPNHRSRAVAIRVTEADGQVLAVDLDSLLHRPSPEAPAWMKPVGWSAIGLAGAALAGAGAAFAVRQKAARRYNSNDCLPNRSESCPGASDRVNSSKTWALVGGIGSLTFAAVGAAILTLARRRTGGKSEARPADSATLRCHLGTAVGCSVAF